MTPKLLLQMAFSLLLLMGACDKDSKTTGPDVETGPLTIHFQATDEALSGDTVEIRETDTLALVVRRRSADPAGLRYTILNNELHGARIDAESGVFVWVPGFDMGGPEGIGYEFIFAVTDTNSFLSRRLIVRVLDRNRPPSLRLFNGFTTLNFRTDPPGPSWSSKTYHALLALEDVDGDSVSLEGVDLPDSTGIVELEPGKGYHFQLQRKESMAQYPSDSNGKHFLDSLLAEEGLAFRGLSWTSDSSFQGTVGLGLRVSDGKSADTVRFQCLSKSPKSFEDYWCQEP